MRVVAEYIGEQSLPSPRRPATERSLRGPLGVTDRRHFQLQQFRNYGPQKFQLVAFAEDVGAQSPPSPSRPGTLTRLRGPLRVPDRRHSKLQ
jgi:hypothetical protein